MASGGWPAGNGSPDLGAEAGAGDAERVQDRPAARPAMAAQTEGPTVPEDVVRGSGWPGGVRGRGTVTVRMGAAVLRQHPLSALTARFTTSAGAVHDLDLSQAAPDPARTICDGEDETWPACTEYRYAGHDLVTFRLGSGERIASLEITGPGVDYESRTGLEKAGEAPLNRRTVSFNCSYTYYVWGPYHPADCGCMATRQDELHGEIDLLWVFEADPPDGLAVETAADTLRYIADDRDDLGYRSAALLAQAVYADGTHAPYVEDRVTYAVRPTPYGSLEWELCRSCDIRGSEFPVPYDRAHQMRYLADGVGGTAETPPAEGPAYDVPLDVVVTGAGMEGQAPLVIAGADGQGPDSLSVSLGAPDVPCGDSTWVSVAGLLGGVPRALPDSAAVRLVVKDSTVARLAWGGQTGAALAVPIEALRDSSVWVQTETCDDLEGDVPVRVCAEVDAYWDHSGVIAGEGDVTVTSPNGPVLLSHPAIVAPGAHAVLSIERADGMDPASLVTVELSEMAAASGGLLVGGAPAPAAIPLRAFLAGEVTFKANLFEGPPPAARGAGTDAAVAMGTGEGPQNAPGAEAAGIDLAPVGASARATLPGGVELRADLGVQPLGIRYDVYPETVWPGQGVLAGVTVTRSLDPAVPVARAYLERLSEATLQPFVCAQGVSDVDASAVHLPLFRPFPYGTTADGAFRCASPVNGWARDLAGLYTTEFTYPTAAAETVPEDGVPLVTYGGLAAQVGGAWVWVSALPETAAGRLLRAERLVTLRPDDRSRYLCTDRVLTVAQVVEKLPACTKRTHSTGELVSWPYSLGTTGSGWAALGVPGQGTFCVDPVTDTWRPALGELTLPTSYSVCPARAEEHLSPDRILTDEADPAITDESVDDYLDAIATLAHHYETGRTVADLSRGPRIANVWVESATAEHERGHARWHRNLLTALAYRGLGPAFADQPGVLELLDLGDVRAIDPHLFDRGLTAILADVTVPGPEARDPGEAAAGAAARVDLALARFTEMLQAALTATSQPLHYRQYRWGARELRRIESVLTTRYGR